MNIENPSQDDIKEKNRLVRIERAKLNKLLADLDKDRKKAAAGLVDECAFLAVSLRMYRAYIDEHGFIDNMQQGDYSIKREHPAVRSYSSLLTKYVSAIDQLYKLLPSKPAAAASDGFDEFRLAR
jgi:hypothetical protein